MKTSPDKRKHHFLFFLHAASSHIALIAMATSALSLGSACIQSEWDLCRDSSGLHLFNLPHWNSLHAVKAGTKRGETPSPRLGMTSKIGATGSGYRECGSNMQPRAVGCTAKAKNGVAAHSHSQFQREIMWNRICYWKPQSLNTWQVLHGSGTGLSLISQNGFWLSLFMSFLKTYG